MLYIDPDSLKVFESQEFHPLQNVDGWASIKVHSNRNTWKLFPYRFTGDNVIVYYDNGCGDLSVVSIPNTEIGNLIHITSGITSGTVPTVE